MTVLFSRQSLAFGESWTVDMGLARGLQKLLSNIQTARYRDPKPFKGYFPVDDN